MNELLHRIKNINIALASQFPKIEIILISLSELADIDFDKIAKQERKIIEHTIKNIQDILKPYKIDCIKGYQDIPEDELTIVITHMKSLRNQLFLRAIVPHIIC